MFYWYDGIWLAGLVVLVAFEIWAAIEYRIATLTVITRKLFHTDVGNWIGRSVFLVIWVPFAIWFTGHIAFGWPP